MPRTTPLVVGVVLMMAAWQQPHAQDTPTRVVNDVALADESQGDDWLGYGRTYREQRFSPLTDINASTVAGLSVDWYLDLPSDRGLVSTPLVVDGVMYFIGSMNVVRAVDATSGEVLWRYDPKVAEYAANRLRAGWDHNRGIAFWKATVLVATWDGRLNAVDAATGRELWSTMTIDPDVAFYITGAPKVFKDKVLIGNGGTENGAARGYVTAYDVATGEQEWRFHIVPGNPADGFENDAMAMAAETWTGEWWQYGGGGNAWHGFTYDPELDAVYIGTGNGSPWNRKIRSPEGGDNLFLCSIVALDPDTGDYLWHYQTTPGETWDYNSNMDIVLADLTIDGREVKALMHAPKNGFFYVIDRETGKLISAEPFTEVTWATEVNLDTGRPVEVPGARYEEASATVAPGPIGGHSWHAMSYNSATGLVYIPTIHTATTFADEQLDLEAWRSPVWRLDTGVATQPAGPSRVDGVVSSLQAWDPVRQERAWEVPLEGIWNAGTLTTAGNLVFQGRANGHLVAYAADRGDVLWDVDLGLGISAPPITYSVDGRQYVALLVGWGGAMAALGALTQPLTAGHTARIPAAWWLSRSTGTLNCQLYRRHGYPVHSKPGTSRSIPDWPSRARPSGQGCASPVMGGGALAAGMAPDLRASGVVLSAEGFAGAVRDGNRVERGMPPYPDLSDSQLTALRHYIRQQAERALEAGAAGR